MSEFSGIAHLDIDGERIEVEHVDIETDLSDKEVFGVERRECDECGALIHPLDMVIVAGTDPERVGVYHADCKP